MLTNLNTDIKIENEDYKKLMEQYELQLGELQRKLKELQIPGIILFEGWDAAGKGTIINNIIMFLDPRGFKVFTINSTNDEERFRPYFWRFWMKLPAKGRLSFFDKSWYDKIIENHVERKLSESEILNYYNDINNFEKQLTDYGYLIIKFFLHIDKKEQKKRFELLEKNKATDWRVTKRDWKHHKLYNEFTSAYEDMLKKTNTENSPWIILSSKNKKYATSAAIKHLIDIFEKKINDKLNFSKESKIINLTNFQSSILNAIDLSKEITKEEYEVKLHKYQKKIRDLEYELYKKRIPVLIMYEGWDAAGKGGNIKRLTENMDPRGYEVVPVAAPNDIEKLHHYLWRFWNYVPKAGHITIFDRTWYGRVLVERIEGFCKEDEWKRAYKEINDTESQLVDYGMIVIKFFLHIDKDEQLRRFNERQNNEFKKWKITDEDWRNREKFNDYKTAIDEMIYRTSTDHAPWNIIEANSKYYARIKALKTVINMIESKL